MRILVVVSGNHSQVAAFVTEQVAALRQAGCEVKLFCVTGRGLLGYLRNLKPLKIAIKSFSPDILHAHYGLCGLLCTLQRNVPVIVTYHGSDINNPAILWFSRLAMRRSAHNIFVSKKLQEKAISPNTTLAPPKGGREVMSFNTIHSTILPCGIDTDVFRPINRNEACHSMRLEPTQHYILFAGAFDNEIKNPQLAKDACALVPNVKLLELKGYGREEVAALMNAADCLLMTSHSEGSPQVTKEALACGCPVVSVDVGDVAEQIEGTKYGVIVERTPEAIANALSLQLEKSHRPYCKEKSDQFDNRRIVATIVDIYKSIIV